MTQPPQTEDGREADAMGEKPDLGRTPDHLNETMGEALKGTNVGSDTRSGSLRGGSASGSDVDPDQAAIDESLASEGVVPVEPARADAEPIKNTDGDGGTS